jgi:quinol monooxygenase YgiN
MSVNMILKLTAKPGQLNRLTDVCAAAFPVTRTFEGCEELHLFKVSDETHTLMIIEQWHSQADYDGYFAWRQGNGTLNEMLDLIEGPIEFIKLERLPA